MMLFLIKHGEKEAVLDTKVSLLALFFSIVSLTVFACDQNFQQMLASSSVESVAISVDKSIENEYCQSWSMSKREIKEYFSAAHIITREERRMAYDWGGCEMRGDLINAHGEILNFSINAGGTASIVAKSKEVYMGCKSDCNDIFDFGFYRNEK